MFQLLHYVYLIVNFVAEDTILDEASFLDLLGSKQLSILLRCKLIDVCKGSFANVPHDVVHLPAIPRHAVVE
jgi:hypothetical protein